MGDHLFSAEDQLGGWGVRGVKQVIAFLVVVALVSVVGVATGIPGPDELRGFVEELCDPAMDGRVVGSKGCDRAAKRIAEKFGQAGMQPGGDDGGWFQTFTPESPEIVDAVLLPEGAAWGTIVLQNVIGRLPGSGEGSVVLAAHYDHLGRNKDGDLYPGADDNASGVAALWAIASELEADAPFSRDIVFIAFSGEETGTLGSRWFVEHPTIRLDATIAMINLDAVGRPVDSKLFAFSTTSAAEFPGALRGVNLGFGFTLVAPEKSPFASDQVPFLEKGIPSIHLFTGPNADYHRPGDTPEKLDYEGILEISAFTSELVRFLADRDRELTFVPPGADQVTPPASSHGRSARRVSLGTIPDFGEQGDTGVLISGVLPGSPAEKAGMRKGDRVTSMDGETIKTLEDFTIALKSREPGDRVRVGFLRDGSQMEIEAVLVERK